MPETNPLNRSARRRILNTQEVLTLQEEHVPVVASDLEVGMNKDVEVWIEKNGEKVRGRIKVSIIEEKENG